MASVLPPYQLPAIRIPLFGVLGQPPLPPPNHVFPDFINLWMVAYTGTYDSVFDVDSFVKLDYDHKQKVSSFPVEKGAFADYNKVNEPRNLKVSLTVHGGTRVKAFLDALETELTSTNLYDIYTPERTYKSFTLEKLSYPRTAEKSVDMVVVPLSFIEVVQVTSQTTAALVIPSSKKAKAKPTTALLPCHTAPAPTPPPVPRLSTFLKTGNPLG
jgi:hypothetical protein